MKKFIFMMLLCPVMLLAQDQEYFMYETIYLDPRIDALEALQKNIKLHNETYHSTAPYEASVWHVVNGPNSGKMVWVMGPTTWTNLDERPKAEGHDEDWLQNISPLCHSEEDVTYWKMDQELSFFPDKFSLAKMEVWLLDIKPFQATKFASILEGIKEVQETYFEDEPYGVYWNELPSSTAGNDVALVWFFEKYASFDQKKDFEGKYESIHGKGSWAQFLRDYESTVQGRETEIREFIPELSPRGPVVFTQAEN